MGWNVDRTGLAGGVLGWMREEETKPVQCKDDRKGGVPSGSGRSLLFPIARPAALALRIRLPLAPERKPVIVPGFALSRAPAHVAERRLSGGYHRSA